MVRVRTRSLRRGGPPRPRADGVGRPRISVDGAQMPSAPAPAPPYGAAARAHPPTPRSSASCARAAATALTRSARCAATRAPPGPTPSSACAATSFAHRDPRPGQRRDDQRQRLGQRGARPPGPLVVALRHLAGDRRRHPDGRHPGAAAVVLAHGGDRRGAGSIPPRSPPTTR